MVQIIHTIAAIATAAGRGGIGIVRVSGPLCAMIAVHLIGRVPTPRQALLCSFKQMDGEVIDKGIAIYFPSPHSFTGEDVLELHGHGGPLVMDLLLSAVLARGAKIAAPGEFTQRAFLNGKMDLAQAEAVADLIAATTKEAALSATRSLQGVFSRQIETIASALMELRVFVESAIDFSEEEIDFLSEKSLASHFEHILAQIETLHKQAKQGQLLREGMSVAIIGRPNAGKSSLFNALTLDETAIVTPIPGTTRDILKEMIQIEGIPIHIMDTAGIRLDADLIEQQGIQRAKDQQHKADRILLVADVTVGLGEVEHTVLADFGYKTTLIMNKIDLLSTDQKSLPAVLDGKIYLSAQTGEGLELLREHLKGCMGLGGADSGLFIARRRHLHALQKTQEYIKHAFLQFTHYNALECVAQELRKAQESLGEIVGKITTEDLLGEIFANFCIGK